jgi:hypothetical protein
VLVERGLLVPVYSFSKISNVSVCVTEKKVFVTTAKGLELLAGFERVKQMYAGATVEVTV